MVRPRAHRRAKAKSVSGWPRPLLVSVISSSPEEHISGEGFSRHRLQRPSSHSIQSRTNATIPPKYMSGLQHTRLRGRGAVRGGGGESRSTKRGRQRGAFKVRPGTARSCGIACAACVGVSALADINGSHAQRASKQENWAVLDFSRHHVDRQVGVLVILSMLVSVSCF